MTIKTGDRLPKGTLTQYVEVESDSCAIGPNAFEVEEIAKGKKIVIFAVPGAFTPTCSEKHLPGFVELADQIKAKGVDEIWCVSVNDAFVMSAWGRDQKVGEQVRMMADGSAIWTQALGLSLDLTQRGMGVRSQRYALIADDGVVTHLAIEAPGAFDVSSAQSILAAL